jgi:hypothetical protein
MGKRTSMKKELAESTEKRASPAGGKVKRAGNEWSKFAAAWYREHKEKYGNSYKACLKDPALKEAYMKRNEKPAGGKMRKSRK